MDRDRSRKRGGKISIPEELVSKIKLNSSKNYASYINNKIENGNLICELKEFTDGYEVYAQNSEFINKFLFYYGNKNGIETNLAKADDYDEISKFLRYGNGVKEYLQSTTESETVALAKLLIKRA